MEEIDQNVNLRGSMSLEPSGEGDMAPKGSHFDLFPTWEVNIVYVTKMHFFCIFNIEIID